MSITQILKFIVLFVNERRLCTFLSEYLARKWKFKQCPFFLRIRKYFPDLLLVMMLGMIHLNHTNIWYFQGFGVAISLQIKIPHYKSSYVRHNISMKVSYARSCFVKLFECLLFITHLVFIHILHICYAFLLDSKALFSK